MIDSEKIENIKTTNYILIEARGKGVYVDGDQDDDLTPYDWRVNVLSTIVALTTGFASQQELELKLPYINKSVWKAYNES